MKKVLLFLICMVEVGEPVMQAVVVGSNTAVSRQATTTFPAVDTNNTMLGFASFENGITLQNAATTCTYNGYLPVSGTVNLNNGRLILRRDLAFSDTTRFATFGHIIGNGYAFSLAPSTSSIDNTVNMTYSLNSTIFTLNNNLTLSVHLSFNNNSTIMGNGFAIDFAQTGSISAGIGASLLLKNVTLKNVSSSRVRCLDTSATITFNNVTMILDNHYAFTVGRFDVVDNLTVQGNYTFSYQSGSVSTVQQRSFLNMAPLTTLRYQPSTTQRNGISLYDASSSLFLNGATLSSSSTGLQLTKGLLVIDGKVNIASDAASIAEGITIGDGVAASNDLNMLIMPAGRIAIQSGYFVNKNLS